MGFLSLIGEATPFNNGSTMDPLGTATPSGPSGGVTSGHGTGGPVPGFDDTDGYDVGGLVAASGISGALPSDQLDLSDVESVEDKGDHFVLNHKHVGPFPVMKDQMGPEAHGQLAARFAMQNTQINANKRVRHAAVGDAGTEAAGHDAVREWEASPRAFYNMMYGDPTAIAAHNNQLAAIKNGVYPDGGSGNWRTNDVDAGPAVNSWNSSPDQNAELASMIHIPNKRRSSRDAGSPVDAIQYPDTELPPGNYTDAGPSRPRNGYGMPGSLLYNATSYTPTPTNVVADSAPVNPTAAPDAGSLAGGVTTPPPGTGIPPDPADAGSLAGGVQAPPDIYQQLQVTQPVLGGGQPNHIVASPEGGKYNGMFDYGRGPTTPVSANNASDTSPTLLKPPVFNAGPGTGAGGSTKPIGPGGFDKVGPGAPSRIPSMESANDQWLKANQNLADTQVDYLKAAQQAHQEYSDTLQKSTSDWTAARAKNQADADDIETKVRNGKINPNQLWDNMGWGGKIGMALSMIGSGGGAALAHQSNAAIDVIHDAINRDMDAQKANLAKNQALMQYYREKGVDIDSMFKQKQANALQAVGAQLLVQADKSGQPAAIQQASMAAAKFKMDAVNILNNMDATDWHKKWDPTIENARLRNENTQNWAAVQTANNQRDELALQKQKLGMDQAQRQWLLSGSPSQNAIRAYQLDPKEGAKHIVNYMSDEPVVDPKTGQYVLDPTTRKPITRSVPKSGYAAGPEGATKDIQEKFNQDEYEKSNLKELRDWSRDNPNGGWPGGEEAQKAETLRTEFLLPFLKTDGINRLNEQELSLIKNMVGDPTSMKQAFFGQNAAAYAAIQKALDVQEEQNKNSLLKDQ